MLFSLAETLALSTRCLSQRYECRTLGAAAMTAINVHQAKDGTKTHRVRVRRRGQPTQTASFSTLQAARQWATMIEGDIIAGRHFPNKKPKHTLNELLDRYVQEIMPRKSTETQRSHRPVVTFWRQKLGHKLLSYMQRMILPLFWRVDGRPSETICVTSRPCLRRYSHCLQGLGGPKKKQVNILPHQLFVHNGRLPPALRSAGVMR